MLIQQLLSFLLSLAVKEIVPYITRLPECGRYHGNFSKRHTGKYFRSQVITTIQNVTRKKCSLHCIFTQGCLFINQNSEENYCELMTSHIGELDERPGWEVASTDYSVLDLRGPMCKYISPACDYTTEMCVDTCEAPGFKCEKLVNVALKKEVKVSSNDNVDTGLGPNAVDGNPGRLWASKEEKSAWIVVDLAARYKIPFVTLFNHQKEENWNRMKRMTIRIGDFDASEKDKNEVCVEKQAQRKDLAKRYVCENGPLVGRYVVVTKSDATKLKFNIGELMVFSV